MDKRQTITVCAFIKNKDKVLIAKRATTKAFLPDKYELPGGHVEFGETLEEALKRELLEEMKISIEVEMPFYAFTYLTDANKTHCIEIDYFAHLKPANQEIKINPGDHSECRWVAESEVSEYLDANDDERKAVAAGFGVLKKIKA
jgi:8-oxo-dGTP diphosphatase